MHNVLLDSVKCTVLGIGEELSPRERGFPPLLENNRIHLWSAKYGDLDRHIRVLSDVISREELNTATTFRNTADARKYILRHGLVRVMLGTYTHQNPEMVLLKTGKNGKPELDLQGAYADISFNLSHTGEMVLISITRKRRIGVDIVKMDRFYQFHDTAEFLFTPAEKAFLQSIEPALRYRIFFRIWALKEAILKATGGTLAMMERTEVSGIIKDVVFSPDCLMKHLTTDPPFFIWEFTCGSGHYGAVAADSRNPL